MIGRYAWKLVEEGAPLSRARLRDFSDDLSLPYGAPRLCLATSAATLRSASFWYAGDGHIRDGQSLDGNVGRSSLCDRLDQNSLSSLQPGRQRSRHTGALQQWRDRVERYQGTAIFPFAHEHSQREVECRPWGR
jgi:hypothetical protein